MKLYILSILLTTTVSSTYAAKYRIALFSQTKDNAVITNVSFHVQATNSGTLDLECTSGTSFKSGSRYACGENFAFAYSPPAGTHENSLTLWQNVEGEWKKGVTSFDEPMCIKGASTPDGKHPDSQVCTFEKGHAEITVEVVGA